MIRSAVWNTTRLARPGALALSAAACAYLGAFEPRGPTVLMVAPVVALGWSNTRFDRIGVSVMAHLAIWSPLPSMATAYGVSPVEAWVGISVVMLSQAVIVGLLPPVLGVALWALSPFGFGHPVFGIFSVMPFSTLGAVESLIASALILVGLAIPQALAFGLIGLIALGAIGFVSTDAPTPSALVPVSTSFAERSMFPSDDWAQIGKKLESVEGLNPQLLPEGTIGQDADRGFEFFSDLARTGGHDLYVGVSSEDGEKIVGFFKDGHVATIYRQVQGVPVINDELAMPWHFFGGEPALIDGERVVFTICFEAFLPLTWVRALVTDSTTVVVVANDRWSPPSVRNAQAKLLSFPWPASTLAAVNFPETTSND